MSEFLAKSFALFYYGGKTDDDDHIKSEFFSQADVPSKFLITSFLAISPGMTTDRASSRKSDFSVSR